MSGRAARAMTALRHVAANPRWTSAYLQTRKRRRERSRALRRQGAAAFSLRDRPDLLHTEEDAIRKATGLSEEGYGRLLSSLWLPQPESADRTSWDSRIVLLRVLSVVVRTLQPRVAVEIGVERGHSSAVTLEAMSTGGRGMLHSIDLPSLETDRPEFTGHVIPDALRDRWHLSLGPSQLLLPELLKEIGEIDLFLHDGDHSYDSQYQDLTVAWPYLRSGGIMIVDDVWSPAFVDFAEEREQEPLLIERTDEHDGVGLLRRAK